MELFLWLGSTRVPGMGVIVGLSITRALGRQLSLGQGRRLPVLGQGLRLSSPLVKGFEAVFTDGQTEEVEGYGKQIENLNNKDLNVGKKKTINNRITT